LVTLGILSTLGYGIFILYLWYVVVRERLVVWGSEIENLKKYIRK
jgi:hypothetical protein